MAGYCTEAVPCWGKVPVIVGDGIAECEESRRDFAPLEELGAQIVEKMCQCPFIRKDVHVVVAHEIRDVEVNDFSWGDSAMEINMNVDVTVQDVGLFGKGPFGRYFDFLEAGVKTHSAGQAFEGKGHGVTLEREIPLPEIDEPELIHSPSPSSTPVISVFALGATLSIACLGCYGVGS